MSATNRDRLRRRSPRPTRALIRFAEGPERLEVRQLLDGGIALSKTSWTPIGPAPILDESSQTSGTQASSGRLSTVAADPSDPKTYYVGAAGGGVWKTVDAGVHWVPLTDNLPTLQMGAIAVAPSNPRFIYAGSGDANNDFAQQVPFLAPTDFTGRGIFKSTDAGATWSVVGLSAFNRYSITKIVVDPTDPNILYVADGEPGVGNLSGNSGIWKSTDGGNTFTNTTAALGTSEWYTDVTIDANNAKVLYGAIGTEQADPGTFFPITGSAVNGVYKSTDAGATWARAGNFPGGATDGRIAVALAPSDSKTLYAATVDLSTLGLKELDASTDGGVTWVKQGNTPNFLGGQGEYDIAIGVDPSNAKKLYVSGQFDYQNGKHIADVTTDGGATWYDLTTQSNNPHTDSHGIAFAADGKLLLANDGGLWRLDDPSTSAPVWADLNTDLNTTEFYGVALDPTDANTVYGGLQDNGTVKFSGALGWHEIQGGDGGITRVDPFNNLTVYAQFPDSPDRSDDGGQSFTDISTNIKGNGNFVEPMILDPSTPNRILVGTDQLNESTDKGSNFKQISTPGQNGWTSTQAIDAIAIAPSDPNTIYASAGGKVFLTTDDGKSWADRSIPNVGDLIGDIQVDPADPKVAYAVRSAFDDVKDRGHVFRTADGGVTWADVSGNLPDGPANTIAIDSTQATAALYVGTNAGVYVSYNLGQTWRTFKVGLPNVRVDQLEFNPKLNILLAGTHGRGAWEVIPTRSNVVVSVSDLGTLTEGTAIQNVVVGTFTDSDPATVDQYSALIQWGDGTVGGGTVVAGSTPGTYKVLGSTTYNEGGSYTLTLSVSKVAGDTTVATGPVVVRDRPINVTARPVAATEGIAFSGTVATVTDADTNAQPAGHYSARVDWGDGTTSAGTIQVGQGGAISVVGGHTYAGFGTYIMKVSVTDLGGGAIVAGTSGATVADQALSPAGATITPTEGATFTSVVATYTDLNPLGTAANVTVSIDWGDGSAPTAGTVTPNGAGGFDVAGTHAYPDALTYQITATVTSDSGVAYTVGSVAVVGVAALSANPATITPQEGRSFTSTVATFTDPNRFLKAGDFTATVDWGDGSADNAAIAADPNGGFDVVGTHTYLVVGSYTTTAVIDSKRGATTTTVGKAFVQDAPLTSSGASLTVVAGATFSGVVATFTDANPFGTVSQFTPTIDWGDGSATAGTVQANPSGGFEVLGTHVYQAFGSYPVSTTIADVGGASTQANAAAIVVDAPISAAASPLSGVEGAAIVGGQLATFVDANPFAHLADFTAQVAWGDGTTSPGTVLARAGGGFRVVGTHTYTYFGTYAVGVTVRSVGGSSATTGGSATLADAPLTTSGLNLSLVEGATFGGLVAHFSDANPFSRPTDFSATINWGDGTTTVASLAPEAGGTTYDVSGSHAYHAGSFPIAVHIVSVGGSTADASGTATVTDAPVTSTGVAIQVVSGTPYSGPVGTFTVASPIAQASDYAATIDWGDGSTPTAGSVTANPAGGFAVSGSHTYRTGTYLTTVAVTEGGKPRVTIAGSATVADAPLSAILATVTAREGVPFATILASFTDPDPSATLASFAASINWGDGTVDAGRIAPNPAGGFSISGGHTYNTGTFPLSVTVTHLGGATVSVGTTVVVANSPLLVSALTVRAVESNPTPAPTPVKVAAFVDSDPRPHPASFYTATIAWGDGTTAVGVVMADPRGGFEVLGAKSFAKVGTYATTVVVTDTGGGPHSSTGSVLVADAPLLAAGTPIVPAVAGALVRATLATFLDTGPSLGLGEFSAQVDWGDGTAATPGVIAVAADPSQGYVVTGTHTYARFGDYLVTTSLASTGGATTSTLSTTAVADTPLPPGGNIAIAASAGVAFRGTIVHFDVPNALASPLDYAAKVEWGDGTISAGTVVDASAGGFDVTGTHSYANAGGVAVTVTLFSLGGNTATATGAAAISNAPIGVSFSAIAPTETVPLTGIVAYLVDANPADLAGRFTAAINWGDGTVDLGKVAPLGSGTFAVVGTHTYAAAATYAAAVTVVEAGGGTAVATGSVAVATRVYPIAGTLSPLSDSGVSNSDGITNVRTPTYNGTAGAGSTVTLYALRADAASPLVAGVGIAGPTGAWSIAAVPLLDGVYHLYASSTNAAGVADGALTPLSGGNPLVIDTNGPSVVGATLDPSTGRFTITIQDDLGGISTPALLDPTHYGFSVINRSTPRAQAVNGVSLAGGSGVGTNPEAITLTINGGRRLRNGSYVLRLAAAGITDAAGNTLVERFFNPFPGDPIGAGNDYVAKFAVSGRNASAPQQYISPAEVRAAAQHHQQFHVTAKARKR